MFACRGRACNFFLPLVVFGNKKKLWKWDWFPDPKPLLSMWCVLQRATILSRKTEINIGFDSIMKNTNHFIFLSCSCNCYREVLQQYSKSLNSQVTQKIEHLISQRCIFVMCCNKFSFHSNFITLLNITTQSLAFKVACSLLSCVLFGGNGVTLKA